MLPQQELLREEEELMIRDQKLLWKTERKKVTFNKKYEQY
jgi:hypothetical protein